MSCWGTFEVRDTLRGCIYIYRWIKYLTIVVLVIVQAPTVAANPSAAKRTHEATPSLHGLAAPPDLPHARRSNATNIRNSKLERTSGHCIPHAMLYGLLGPCYGLR